MYHAECGMPTSAKPAAKASAKTSAKNPAPVLPTVRCKDTQAFIKWLAKHHASSAGVWLQIAKKGSGIASITHAQALEAAIESGDMRPAGLAEVERAKADGRWDAAYDAQSKMTVPDDLATLLAKNAKAKAFFESLDSRNRFAILFRLQTAKKSETRERRLAKFADMLKRGEKIYP
ncbi:MAG: YdeI/OmpD-associated family protein [Polaromonas sp.]|nr:YdeI/OmpD-associated family protein [Polaromonas sp.]